MIHLVKNSYDGINGLSVISYAVRSIKLANNTENSANSFFTNGCNLSGVLTVQG
jgi:phage portal protein BeeE